MRTLKSLILTVALVAGLFASSAFAATITWGAVSIIGADTDINTAGNLIAAFNDGTAGVTSSTVNGVTFAPLATTSTPTTSGNFTLSGTALAGTNTLTSVLAPFTNLSANYKTLLSTATTAGPNVTITLQMSGLTIGGNYLFQWRVCDTTLVAARSTTATAGNSISLSHNTTNTLGGVGQFVTGTFTADAVTQNITFVSTTQTQINSFQLRQLLSSDLTVSTPNTVTSPIVAGSNIVYTFNALNNTAAAPSNSAPANTVQVTVNMPVPTAGTTAGYVSLTVPAGWTFTPPAVGSTAPIVVTNTTAALVNGTPQSFSLTTKINSGATGTLTQSNTIAYTAASGNTDPTAGNNTVASAASTLTFVADLGISLAGVTSYTTATSRVVTITITNAGPSDAPPTVYFQIPLTAGVTCSNYSLTSGPAATLFNPNGTQSSNALQANFSGPFPAGATAVLSVTETATTAISYTDMASVLSTAPVSDPVSNNNNFSLSGTVTLSPNVALTTTITPNAIAGFNIPGGTYPAGDGGQVFINMNNSATGSAAVTSATVTLPAQMTIGALTSPQSGFTVSKSGQVVTISSGSVTQGTPVSISIPISVASNLANNTSMPIAAPVLVLSGASQNPAPTGATTTSSVVSDVAVTISTPAGTTPGLTRTMTVTVTNSGLSDAPSVTLTMNPPAGTTLNAFSQTGGTAAAFTAAGTNQFTLASMGSTLNRTFTFTENITSSTTGNISETATVTTNGGTNAADFLTANNTFTTTTTALTPTADLQVSIVASGSVTAGPSAGNRTLTVTLTNAGPSDAQSVVLTENPAAGATLVSFVQSGFLPTFTASGSNAFTLVSMTAGANKQFTLNETINAATTGALSDTASVTSTTPDSNAGNNSATSTINSVTISSDVGITVSAPTGTPVIGGNLTYTVSVFNLGPSTATNVTILDDFFASNTNLTYVSSAAGANTPQPVLTVTTIPAGNLQGTIASLPPVAQANAITFTVVAQIKQSVPAGTSITNKLTITSGTPDPVLGNNTAFSGAVTAVSQSDIVVTITNNTPAIPTAGANETYTITVKNTGVSNATTIGFSSATPSGTTFVSLSQTGPSSFPMITPAVGGTGSITAPNTTSLAAGASIVITLVVNVNLNAGNTPISLTVSSLLGAPATDPNAGNNTNITLTITANSSFDTAITALTTTSPTVTPGGTAPTNQITYTFNVVNNGPSNANGMVITDSLPAGTTFVGMTQSAVAVIPTVNGSNVLTYTILGTTAPNTTIPFTITISVPSNLSNLTSISNTVSVSQGSNDPNTNNQSMTTSVTVASSADLSISVVPSPNPVIAGNTVSYSVTVTNNGPSDAQLPKLTFPLPGPNQITVTSFTVANGWTQTSTVKAGDTAGTFTATIPVLTTGSSGTFTFTLTVGGSVVSDLVIAGPTINSSAGTPTPDAVSANNIATNNGSNTTFTVAVMRQPAVVVDTIQVNEGDLGINTATFTVSLVDPVTLAPSANTASVSVDYTTVDGTALNPYDYILQTTTLNFAPGITSQQVQISIIGNQFVEPNKAFTLHMQNPINTSIKTNDGVCTILNDDFGGVLQFSASNYVVNENAGTATITVTRPATAIADQTYVDYSTSDGIAKAGLDYTATQGTLKFGFGITSQSFTVQLSNRNNAPANATVNLTLSNPVTKGSVGNITNIPGASATLGSPSTATLTILARPGINSPPSAQSLISTPFSFTPTASGQSPINFSLGAGSTVPPGITFLPGTGNFTGTPTKTGSFTVNLIATNAVGMDTQMLTFVIIPNTVSGGSNSMLDSDGDGYPDEIEIAAGSDPFDATSTPLSIKSLAVAAIKNVKLSIRLDFTQFGNDSLKMTGAVVMPPNFAQSGKLVYFDIGGVIHRCALDSKGSSQIGSDTVKFKFSKPGSDGKALGTFSLTIKNGDFRSTTTENAALPNALPLLDDEGLTNSNANAVPCVVPVFMLLNSSLYTVQQNQLYTATKGKSGKSKNP